VQFDMFRSEHKSTTVFRRRLATLAPNTEEFNDTSNKNEYSAVEFAEVENEDDTEGRKKNFKEFLKLFPKLNSKYIKTATM
jgi:hypothetical protein